MERRYWTGRMHAAMTAARGAATSESRLIHYDLAGRYSIKAADCLPFLLAGCEPATVGERPVLHLREPGEAAAPPEILR